MGSSADGGVPMGGDADAAHDERARARGDQPGNVHAWDGEEGWEVKRGGSTSGKVIDAGSIGCRMHVYDWKKRVFDTVPPPMSFPAPSGSWTNRTSPGLSTYANNLSQIRYALEPMIDFAKNVSDLHLMGTDILTSNSPATERKGGLLLPIPYLS